MRIVTAGSAYIDIDAYAGCIAYAELLRIQGIEARAVSTAPLNETINETIRSWGAPLRSVYEPTENDTFTLIDISNSVYFDKIVDLEKIEEIIDHHTGYEKTWQKRLGKKAHIEFIGAACTLVYERWEKSGHLDKMSPLSAGLLMSGILDNTLNLGAKITTERDITAYKRLSKIAHLPDEWPAQYFTECQNSILENATVATQNDMKTITYRSYSQPICVGQLAVWDAKQVLAKHHDIVQETLARVEPHWYMNLICISERKSYFVTDNTDVQQWLENLLDVRFDGSIAVANRLWLRKEIFKLENTKGNNE